MWQLPTICIMRTSWHVLEAGKSMCYVEKPFTTNVVDGERFSSWQRKEACSSWKLLIRHLPALKDAGVGINGELSARWDCQVWFRLCG